MIQKMLVGSGVNSGKCKAGTFTVSSQGQTVTVNDVGFKPKQIAIVFQGANGTGTTADAGSIRLIYDERVSTTYCHKGQKTASTESVSSVDMANDLGIRITEVNNNGFKFYNSGGSNFYGTYYYFAIG